MKAYALYSTPGTSPTASSKLNGFCAHKETAELWVSENKKANSWDSFEFVEIEIDERLPGQPKEPPTRDIRE